MDVNHPVKGRGNLRERISPDAVESRFANAFFGHANVSDDTVAAYFRGSFFGHLLSKTIARQVHAGRKRQKGLWVGGKCVLTPTTLSFTPNSLNKSLHVDPDTLSISIPLSSITEVTVCKGIITDVIEIHSAVKNLTIKCFKAKSFAVAIETTRDTRS